MTARPKSCRIAPPPSSRGQGFVRDGRHRHAGLQPHLEDRPDRPLGDRHRFLQAPDGADDLSPPSRRRRSPSASRTARRGSASPTSSTTASCASSSTMSARCRLTRGESTWLRGNTFYGTPADVLAGVHGLARGVPLPRIPAREARRAIRADLPRPLDRDHDVGDSGARDPQRAALARRHPRAWASSSCRCSMPAP